MPSMMNLNDLPALATAKKNKMDSLKSVLFLIS